MSHMQPLVEHIPYSDANQLAISLCQQSWGVFLDSSDTTHAHARYSAIGLDPFTAMVAQEPTQCPFSLLQKLLNQHQGVFNHPELPAGLQGGIIGYLGYDCGLTAETDISHQQPSLLPKWALACYDALVVFDHKKKRAWVISTGLPETSTKQQKQRAEKRLTWLKSLCINHINNRNRSHTINPVTSEEAKSNTTKNDYMAMVKKTQENILRGDCFEVNVAQRFTAKRKSGNNMDIYQQLRCLNPSPFAAFMQLPKGQAIASSSPEQFLQCHNKHIITSPIKGSMLKSDDPAQDQTYQQQLLNSKKDHAENVMIVDLLRNDLSQVCHDASVHVSKLCELETFPTLHHLVSCIEGTLLPQHNAVDLLQACFPGGSISGAPKIQAMKSIALIEQAQRGPYCGSLFHLGFNGSLDSNLLIRTLCLDQENITYHAGGAVTLDSDPQAEWAESMLKSQALTKAIGAR